MGTVTARSEEPLPCALGGATPHAVVDAMSKRVFQASTGDGAGGVNTAGYLLAVSGVDFAPATEALLRHW
jgi:hypothetical protein